MRSLFRPALALLLVFSVLTGLVYPAVMTGLGRVFFRQASDGSLVSRNGKLVGSRLIGQSFSTPGYFWSRPSATAPMANNGAASGGSNLGPLNPALVDAVKSRLEALRAAGPNPPGPVPSDLVTASASGLDPDISPAGALYQVDRIARTRGLPVEALIALVNEHVTPPEWGLFGAARVNVLELNLALDGLQQAGVGKVPGS